MTLRHRLLLPAVCLATAFGFDAAPAIAVGKNMKVATDAAVVDITVSSWLEYVPRTGLIPITVSVRNLTDAPGQWEIGAFDQDYINGSMQSNFVVSAPAGGSTQTQLLVPLMPNYDRSNRTYKNVRLTVKGPGVNFPGFAGTFEARTAGSSSTTSYKTPFTVLSEGFESRNGRVWKSAVVRDWQGDIGRMRDAPSDWRAYSGITQLWMLEAEWNALTRPQRDALFAWVAQGGALFVNTTNANVDLPWLESSDRWKGQEREYGLGTFRAVTGQQISAQGATLIHLGSELALEQAVSNPVAEGDSLKALVPPLKMNSTLIFAFILIFGIVVGPVNLFWLAAGPRRPRLFWTTPLISCAGTAVLLAVMVLQDGFGGTGARVALALVLPEQKQMSVMQEQYSKTGILTGSAFDMPAHESAWISPLPEMREVKTARYGTPARMVEKREYSVSGARAASGWFSSRAVQSHLLNSQRLNRGGIEAGGTDKPYVISSLNTPLRSFYYRDGQGKLWKADAVPVGQRTPLTAVNVEEVLRWKVQIRESMGRLMRTRLDRCASLPNGTFLAEAAEPDKIALPTLGSIEWTADRAFVAGTCTAAAAQP